MADNSFAVQQKKQTEREASLAKRENTPPLVVQVIPAPLDFSFLELDKLEAAVIEEPRPPVLGKLITPRGENKKYDGRSLRLNNNRVTQIETLPQFLDKMFVNPAMIGWIDLSFNALTVIDAALLKCPQLKILYLHANNITDIKEVDKLNYLTNLHKLTLHGNGIENEKGYKHYVVSLIPGLRNLDFSAVTKCDARTAQTWRSMNDSKKKKKKIESDD